MNRRQWFKTTAGLLLAPAVVQSTTIMQVKPVIIKPKFLTMAEIIEHVFNHPEAKRRLINGVLSTNSLMAHTMAMPKEYYLDATRHS